MVITLISRWNIEAVDTLPEYMKLIYRTLLDAFNEIEEDMAKQGRSHCVRYAKEAVCIILPIFFSFKLPICVLYTILGGISTPPTKLHQISMGKFKFHKILDIFHSPPLKFC